jgi:hypothetical protein
MNSRYSCGGLSLCASGSKTARSLGAPGSAIHAARVTVRCSFASSLDGSPSPLKEGGIASPPPRKTGGASGVRRQPRNERQFNVSTAGATTHGRRWLRQL